MLGMANRSDLSMRVSAVLDDRQRRGRAGLGLVAGAVAASALVVLTIAPVRAAAKPLRKSSRPGRGAGDRQGAAGGKSRALDRELYEAAESRRP